MLVFRVAKAKWARDLTGAGARLYGGRWNHPGTPLIYASESRSLATLEYLVHVDLAHVPSGLRVVTLRIPDDAPAEEFSKSKLPRGWKGFPPPSRLADLGTAWARGGRSLLLYVPSAIVEHERNVLVNPAHPAMSRVTVQSVDRHRIDPRLAR